LLAPYICYFYTTSNETVAVLPEAVCLTVTTIPVPTATPVTVPEALTVNLVSSAEVYVTALSVTLVGTNVGVILAV